MTAIDFDDCGFGHHSYDIAIPVAELRWREDVGQLRTALPAGYRAVRPLSAAAEASIDAFMELKRIQLTFWTLDRRTEDMADSWRAELEVDLDGLRTQLGS